MRITDQLGRQIDMPERPFRIVSLCPSETETLAALVAPDRLVGCTRYCKYPEALIASLPHVGGTKQLDLERITSLSPDLIVAIREENDKAQIEQIAQNLPVLVLDPVDHATTLQSIELLGRAVGEPASARTLIRNIETRLATLAQAKGQRALYLIWRKPYMAAGSGTFIDAMLSAIGLVNAASSLSARYPLLDDDAIKSAAPEIIFASSEPFPFEQKHLSELEARFPDCQIHLVDGEAFGWHGVRTLHVGDELNRLVDKINIKT